MKRIIIFSLLLLILLSACAPEVQLDASTTVTRTGTVTDQAMACPDGGGKIWDESYPYLGIEFEDGTGLCIWNKNQVYISEQIVIGSVVEVTYGLQQNSNHWILIEIKEIS